MVEPGTEVSWSVVANGYFSQSGTEVVEENITKVINLINRTTTFAVSSLATGTGTSSGLKTRWYRASYSFSKGKSYTISIKFGSRASSGYNGYTSTSTTMNASGTPSVKTQQWVSDSSNIAAGSTKTVTFTANANAPYLVLTLIDAATAPTLSGNVTIRNNS